MLQIAADVRTVQAEGIVAVGAFDMMRLRQRLAEVAAHEILVAQFRPEGRPSCEPVKIAPGVHTVHIRTVIVVFHFLRHPPVTLIAVAVLVPVKAGAQVQRALLRAALDGRHPFGGMLILFVGLPFRRGVERARAPPFVRQSQVPVQLHVAVLIASLIESFRAAEVRVQPASPRTAPSVAARVVRRYGMAAFGPSAAYIPIAIRSSLRMQGNALGARSPCLLVSLSRHDIHRSYQRRCAIDSACRPLDHLDSHDIAQVNGQIHRIVARLRVTDIDAVQQQDNLFGSTASD